MSIKETEKKILQITEMIYAREGCFGNMSLKEFFESPHPAETSAAEVALRIYNLITESEYEEEEFTI